jgi:hypothetical protein
MNCYNSPSLDRIERSVEVMVSSDLIVNGSFLDLWHRLSQLYVYLDDIDISADRTRQYGTIFPYGSLLCSI